MIFGVNGVGQSHHNLNDERISSYNELNNYQDFHYHATQHYHDQDYLGMISVSTRYLLHSPTFVALLVIIGFTTAMIGVCFGFFSTAVASQRVKLLEFFGMIMLMLKSF